MIQTQPKPLIQHLDCLADEIARHRHHYLFFDFDGTLVPIMERPSECWLDGKSRVLLSAIQAHTHVTVGVISGRKLSDLRNRVNLNNLIYSGNHGLEIEGPHLSFLEPTADTTRQELTSLVNSLKEALIFMPDAWVEHKRLTASVHFRQVVPVAVPHLLDLVEQVTASAVQQHRFVLRHGKQVVEIRPAVSWNKSKALQWIMAHTPHSSDPFIMYFGDDDTDEDIFAEWPQACTVCVGRKSVSAARYQLELQQDMQFVLEWLRLLLQKMPIPDVEDHHCS